MSAGGRMNILAHLPSFHDYDIRATIAAQQAGSLVNEARASRIRSKHHRFTQKGFVPESSMQNAASKDRLPAPEGAVHLAHT